MEHRRCSLYHRQVRAALTEPPAWVVAIAPPPSGLFTRVSSSTAMPSSVDLDNNGSSSRPWTAAHAHL
ncbi:hypothetical protein NL676_013841 [Syzygium grande]|nr:hypothetical protein NL676_013841 [Syzygium grande]